MPMTFKVMKNRANIAEIKMQKYIMCWQGGLSLIHKNIYIDE